MIRNDLQSRTIDALRLVMIFGVVIVHSYTATRADIDSGDFPIYRFVSFLCSLNIAQAAIPGFFFISGYLYFFHTRPYTERLRHSWYRLLIPYLIWNGLILAMYWCVEAVPALRSYLSGDNLPVHNYAVGDFIRAFWDDGHWEEGNGTPILHQFWYIRNLLLLGLLSPLIRRYIRWTGMAGLALLALWWIFAPGQAMVAKSFAFFSFGAWFSLRRQDFLPLFRRYAWPSGVLFLLFAGLTMCFWQQPWANWLNRANDILGVAFFANLVAWFLEKRKITRQLTYLQGLTFFIYAAHDPLIIFVKRMLLRLSAPPTDASLTAVYFIAPLAVMFTCTAVYYLLKYACPRLLYVLVGSRIPKKTRTP